MSRIVIPCCLILLLSLFGPSPLEGGEPPVAHVRLDEGTRVQGGTLIKGRNADTVYVVDGGLLRPVTQNAHARLWSGFDGVLSVAAVAEDAVGDVLEAGTRLVAVRGGTELWLIENARVRRRVASFAAVRAWGFDLALVETTTTAVIDAFPEGPPVVAEGNARGSAPDSAGATYQGLSWDEWWGRLFSPKSFDKTRVNRALLAFGPHTPGFLDIVTAGLRSEDPAVRSAVVYIARGAGIGVVAPLAGLLGDEAESIRLLAALSLGEIGPAAAPAVPALIAALGKVEMKAGPGWTSWPTWQREGMRALAEIGPAHEDALPALVRLLAAERDWTAAVEALSSVGKPAVAAIAPALEDEARRGPALLVLEAVAPGDPRVIPGLVGLLENEKGGLVEAAFFRLDEREDLPPDARAALEAHRDLNLHRGRHRNLKAMGGGRSGFRWRRQRVYALRIREEAAEGRIAPALGAALADPEWEFRAAAVAAFREVEPFPAAVKALRPGLLDRDRCVREVTLKTLIGMGATAIPLLSRLLESSEAETRWRAARGLEAVAGEDEDALKPLLALLGGPDPELAAIALRARWAAERRGAGNGSGR